MLCKVEISLVQEIFYWPWRELCQEGNSWPWAAGCSSWFLKPWYSWESITIPKGLFRPLAKLSLTNLCWVLNTGHGNINKNESLGGTQINRGREKHVISSSRGVWVTHPLQTAGSGRDLFKAEFWYVPRGALCPAKDSILNSEIL